MLVSRAIRSLPTGLLKRLENVAIVVERWPTAGQRERQGESEEDLLGLYEGVPLTERGSGYGMVLPDRIILFQESIEAICATDAEIRKQVQRTVIHEVAHHLGMTDEELERLGWQ